MTFCGFLVVVVVVDVLVDGGGDVVETVCNGLTLRIGGELLACPLIAEIVGTNGLLVRFGGNSSLTVPGIMMSSSENKHKIS